MARNSDLVAAEIRERAAKKARDAAMRDAETLRAFIRETGQADVYMEWNARRLGLHDAIYGATNGQLREGSK